MTLTEGDIRRIIREEVQLAFHTLASRAERLDTPYETGELERAGLQACAKAAEAAGDVALHGPVCDTRFGRYAECDCGLDQM